MEKVLPLTTRQPLSSELWRTCYSVQIILFAAKFSFLLVEIWGDVRPCILLFSFFFLLSSDSFLVWLQLFLCFFWSQVDMEFPRTLQYSAYEGGGSGMIQHGHDTPLRGRRMVL
ncbi:hypothetical protein BDZ91DRAFT_723830 [Kalaharituber pfeilii]|nr:hypothetical protein BDZ91DRAFT_723830 [Kalaharituber pfeilii]